MERNCDPRSSPKLFTESNLDLKSFIATLSRRLIGHGLEIINSPACLIDSKKLKAAQDEVQLQMMIMKNYGLQCGATTGLVHLSFSESDSEKLCLLSLAKVREYYRYQALLTMDRRKCTCEGLCAVVFELAMQLLGEGSHNKLTVELCALRNWSHTLLHFSKTRADGGIESVFYDPWYQLCFSDTPEEPKLFLDEDLGGEVKNLIRVSSPLITHTESLVRLEGFEREMNGESDFAYFVACSNQDFCNPAEARADPSVALGLCLIC